MVQGLLKGHFYLKDDYDFCAAFAPGERDVSDMSCGICGPVFNTTGRRPNAFTRDYETGGFYYPNGGPISETYKRGQTIEVLLDVNIHFVRNLLVFLEKCPRVTRCRDG